MVKILPFVVSGLVSPYPTVVREITVMNRASMNFHFSTIM